MRTAEFTVSHSACASPCVPTGRALETAALFGLSLDRQRKETIVPLQSIAIPIPGIAFMTGPSGGGKSTILRLLRDQCSAAGLVPLAIADLPPVECKPIVDCLGTTLAEAHGLLSRVGLADAFAMLRSPGELSDGQRCRFDLARLIGHAQGIEAQGRSAALLVDEFTAALDRATARTIARNLRKWIDATPHVLICATANDDVLESLQPEVLIWKGLGTEIEVENRNLDLKFAI